MPNRRVFQQIGGLRVPKSLFDLSYSKTFTCDMGQLIPVMCDECVPGDVFKIGNEAVIRFQPLVAPILHEINMYTHYFFVPYRLIWDEWETFITGGVTGDETPALPRWEPTDTSIGSLWDYFGLPTGVDPDGAYPLDFMRIAYNYVFNQYYRDQNLQLEVALNNETILNRNWGKDYFSSALLEQQRGTPPALPVTLSGTSSAAWADSSFGTTGSALGILQIHSASADPKLYVSNADPDYLANVKAFLNGNSVDLSSASATTFDIADLRYAFQVQKWMERNERSGVRYREFLLAHFGETVPDSRLQRPEYIGGSRSGIVCSEVLQTSSSDTTSPQGNLAGHGIGISRAFAGKYRCQEFGLIIGIMSVMPKTMYQQGINRQWLRRSKFDFFFPEFAHLSEQAVERAEIYASGVPAENVTIFGYQGRYNEMRSKDNMVCGQMRDTFDYWHLGRQFSSAPELNETFIECLPSDTKRIFAVPAEPGLIVSFGNKIHAFRPMPIEAVPGLIDHY